MSRKRNISLEWQKNLSSVYVSLDSNINLSISDTIKWVMGDCLQADKPSIKPTAKVNSAFYPSSSTDKSGWYLCQIAGNTVWFYCAGHAL